MTVERRTNYDDTRIRDWHRTHPDGRDYPVVDLDCILVQYDRSKPVAMLEYKHENVGAINYRDANYTTLINLATAAGVPLFNVVWTDDLKEFSVTPLNVFASFVLKKTSKMHESEYEYFIKFLRRPGEYMPYELQRDG